MWISKNSLEAKLARVMGYEYCTLFDTARRAIREWIYKAPYTARTIPIPSNVCPAILEAISRPHIQPIWNGIAPGSGFCLYGYRDSGNPEISIDPLMTGFLREAFADYCVISFGPKKMLDAGGGGALLSNEKFRGEAYFPEALRERIEKRLGNFLWDIERRREQIDYWDCHLGDSCVRIPLEQVMPWRVMRRIPDKRDEVVKAIRDAGYPVGTNYPPLPGVTDPVAIQWGKEVINFFPDSDDRQISEIVKRTLNA